MRERVKYMLAAALAATSLALACASTDKDGRVHPTGPDGPNAATFKAVAPMLMRRCGSIDCHGSTYRNFRLYGFGGTRLRDAGRPDDPPFLSNDEVQANYEAVIGIEPELTREVVRSGGAGYERLTLVRKARGEEAHKGGGRIIKQSVPPDPGELCLLSWLSNTTDIAACEKAGCVGDGGIITACEP